MFDPTKFDELLRKAKEFDKVMDRYMKSTSLPMIDAALRTLSESSKEAGKLLRVLDDIKGDFRAIALENAKMNRAELEAVTKFQKRRDIMDQILDNIQKQNIELTQQRDESNAIIKSLQHRFDLEKQLLDSQVNNLKVSKQIAENDLKKAKSTDAMLKAQDRLFEIEEKLNKLQLKEHALNEKTNKAVDKQLVKQKKLHEMYRANVDAAAEVPGMKAANNRAELEEKRQRRIKFLKKSGGGLITPLVDELGLGSLAGLFGGLGAAILTITGLIGTGLVMALRETLSSAHSLTNQGVNLGQPNSGNVLPAGLLSEVHTRTGLQASPTDINSIRGAYANSLGTLNFANQGEMIAQAQRLNQMYGITVEQSAEIFGNVSRWSHGQKNVADSVYKTVTALAAKNGVPVGTVFKDMASNAEIFAKYAGRGAEAFAKAVISARQYGVTLESASGFADRIVNDFEGSLKMQAQVQTFLPGANFAGVQYASQFGTDNQVLDELSKMLKDTGLKSLDQLPRSIRNMLLSSTGLSAVETQNLLSGKPTGTALISPTETESNKLLADIDKWVQQIAQQGITATILSPSKWFGAFIGALGEEAHGVPSKIALPDSSKLRTPIVRHNGGMVDYNGAPRYHRGFMPNEVPAILQRGEAVLSHAQLAGLTQLMNLTQTLGSLGGTVSHSIPHSSTDIASRVFGGKRVGQASGLMNLVSGSGLGSTISSGAGSLLSGGLGKLAGLALGGPIGGIAASLLGGKIGSIASVGAKAISGIGSAIGGLFGHKKKATPPQPQANPLASLLALAGIDGGASASGPSNVEKLLQELIASVKEGKDVYLDGKKVGSSLVSSLGRG